MVQGKVVLTRHIIDAYRLHHPEAEAEAVLEAIALGIDVDEATARPMLGRPTANKHPIPSLYRLAPDRRGLFALIVKGDKFVGITYLRFQAVQRQFALKHWPTPDITTTVQGDPPAPPAPPAPRRVIRTRSHVEPKPKQKKVKNKKKVRAAENLTSWLDRTLGNGSRPPPPDESTLTVWFHEHVRLEALGEPKRVGFLAAYEHYEDLTKRRGSTPLSVQQFRTQMSPLVATLMENGVLYFKATLV